MILSESVLKDQLCTTCKKYLSVSPIKVYPNKQIKCGRCSQENDGGTISTNYEKVVKNVKFPCTNRIIGCNIKLPLTAMGFHEKHCISKKYNCPLCFTFFDHAHGMALHIEETHKKHMLSDKMFCIDLRDSFCIGKIYFYSNNRLLLYVELRHISKQHFAVAIKLARLMPMGDENIEQRISILSIDNDILFKSKVPYSQWGSTDNHYNQFVQIDLSPSQISKGLVFCKFEIIIPSIQFLKDLDTVTPLMEEDSLQKTVLKCVFKNIKFMVGDLDKSIAQESCYLMGIVWKFCITFSGDLILKWEDVNSLGRKLFYITGLVRVFHKKNSKLDVIMGWPLALLDTYAFYFVLRSFDDKKVFDLDNGYIENDSITAEISFSLQNE